MDFTEQSKTDNLVSFDAAMPLPPAQTHNSPNIIDPDSPHWSIFAATGIFLLSVFLIGLMAVIAVGLYAVFKGFPQAAGELVKDPIAIIVNLAAIFPAHFLTILAAWLLVTRGGKQPFFRTLGWDWKNFGFWSCLGITIALYGIGIGIISILGEQENELIRILQSSRTAVYLTAIMASFTAPMVEEVVYRGILYPAFRKTFNAPVAVIAVTALFALVHVPQYLPSYGTILIICLLSLVLTLIRAWTGSLLPCFVIHTFFNGIQSILLIAQPYFERISAPEVKPAIIKLLLNIFFM